MHKKNKQFEFYYRNKHISQPNRQLVAELQIKRLTGWPKQLYTLLKKKHITSVKQQFDRRGYHQVNAQKY